MTHIPSVIEAYAHLRSVVVDCRLKLSGFTPRWEIEEDGIRVTLKAQDGTTNTRLTEWDVLGRAPQRLSFDTGICAAELFEMMKFRAAKRSDLGG